MFFGELVLDEDVRPCGLTGSLTNTPLINAESHHVLSPSPSPKEYTSQLEV